MGFADREQFYQVRMLSVLDRQTGVSQVLTQDFDRDVASPSFDGSGKSIYFQFDERGNTHIGTIANSGGKVASLAADLGGADIGRPYGVGSMMLIPLEGFANNKMLIKNAELLALDDDYFLNANIEVKFGDEIEQTLLKGFELNFILEFQLASPRQYWFDDEIVTITYPII